MGWLWLYRYTPTCAERRLFVRLVSGLCGAVLGSITDLPVQHQFPAMFHLFCFPSPPFVLLSSKLFPSNNVTHKGRLDLCTGLNLPLNPPSILKRATSNCYTCHKSDCPKYMRLQWEYFVSMPKYLSWSLLESANATLSMLLSFSLFVVSLYTCFCSTAPLASPFPWTGTWHHMR